jgi:hypothetical protein
MRATGREIELGPERSSLRNQGREQVIAAAYGFLSRGYRDALEVGPMSRNPDGKVLDERDLSRLWEKSLGAATPVPFARGDRGQAQELDHWRRSHG